MLGQLELDSACMADHERTKPSDAATSQISSEAEGR